MDIEISCKGHFEKLSHFLDLVSHTAEELIHQLLTLYQKLD